MAYYGIPSAAQALTASVGNDTVEVANLDDEVVRAMEEAMPALEAGRDLLRALKQEHLKEVRSVQIPARGQQLVLTAIAALLGKTTPPTWQAGVEELRSADILQRLEKLDVTDAADSAEALEEMNRLSFHTVHLSTLSSPKKNKKQK